MATAKLKRKPRLSKIESYKAANIKDANASANIAIAIAIFRPCDRSASVFVCVVVCALRAFKVINLK